MAEALSKDTVDVDPNGDFDDVDDEFETPPASPDDVRMALTAELEQEIADLQLAEDYIKRNQESIAKSQASLREFQTTMVKLISQAEGRTSELKNRTVTLQTMKQEIDEISMEAIAKEEEELKKLITTEAAHIQEAEESPKATDLETLKQQMEPHQDDLSFSIDMNEEWIACTFTNVDSQSQGPTGTVQFGVGDGGVYKCIRCSPNLDQCEEVFSQLNQHQDLRKFLVQLRQEFAASISEEN